MWYLSETALQRGYHTLCYKQATSWYDMKCVERDNKPNKKTFAYSCKIFPCCRYWQSVVWIGLRRGVTAGDFQWVDGTRVSNSQWKAGYPQKSDKTDCVAMFNDDNRWVWNNYDCDQPILYLCEDKGNALNEHCVKEQYLNEQCFTILKWTMRSWLTGIHVRMFETTIRWLCIQ